MNSDRLARLEVTDGQKPGDVVGPARQLSECQQWRIRSRRADSDRIGIMTSMKKYGFDEIQYAPPPSVKPGAGQASQFAAISLAHGVLGESIDADKPDWNER